MSGTPRKTKGLKPEGSAAVKAEPKSPSEAKKVHQKLKTLKQKGNSSLLDKYNKCGSEAEKCNFYYNVYMLDPSVSAKAVLKKDLDMQGTVTTEQEGWWTQDQICVHKAVLPHNPQHQELALLQ